MNFNNMSGYNFGEPTIYNAYENFANFDQHTEHFQEGSIYEKVHEFGSNRKFSTTHDRDNDGEYTHHVINENVNSREECETLCTENDNCIGFIIDNQSSRCIGLNDLGIEGGSNTKSNIEGWKKIQSISISTSSDGNWGTNSTWSVNDEDISDYVAISENTIEVGTTVNIRNNVTISEGETIINNGTIIVSSGKTLNIYTDIINNNSIRLLNNSTLIINRDTKITNNGNIQIYTDSTLTLNGVLLDTNIEDNSIINDGSVNATEITSNNNIFYYYGESDNILNGNVSTDIVQTNVTSRVMAINDVHNSIQDSSTLINLEKNLLKYIIDENDDEINQYINIKVIRNNSNKTRFEHIGDGSESIIGWKTSDDDTIYTAEKKETHYLVANTLFKSANIYLETNTINNLVSNVRSMNNINEESNIYQIANKISETITKSHELSVGIAAITLNTARLRLYFQEYDKLLSGEDYSYDNDPLNTLRNVSKIPCNDPATKDCLISKLFFRLAEECSNVVPQIKNLTDKLAKLVKYFLFSETLYNELTHILTYAQASVFKIKKIINVWNFILNVNEDDDEWTEFTNAPNIDNAWNIIYNKDGNYNLKTKYKVTNIYNSESKINQALRNNRILQEYLCDDTLVPVVRQCPNTKSVIATLLENLGSLEELSQTIFGSVNEINTQYNAFIKTREIQAQQTPEVQSGIILPSDRTQSEIHAEENQEEIQEEIQAEIQKEVQELSKTNLLEFVKNNIIYIVLLIINIVILVKYY